MVKQLTHIVKKTIYGRIFQNYLVIFYAKYLAEMKKTMYNINNLIINCHKNSGNSIDSACFSIERGI